MVGEQHLLRHVCCGRPDVVRVQKRFEFGRDIGIHPVADNDYAGIDEVGLTFSLAAAEIRHQAFRLLKIHRGASEVESLVNVKAKWPANEKRAVENGVEPCRMRVSRIGVPAGKEA